MSIKSLVSLGILLTFLGCSKSEEGDSVAQAYLGHPQRTGAESVAEVICLNEEESAGITISRPELTGGERKLQILGSLSPEVGFDGTFGGIARSNFPVVALYTWPIQVIPEFEALYGESLLAIQVPQKRLDGTIPAKFIFESPDHPVLDLKMNCRFTNDDD